MSLDINEQSLISRNPDIVHTDMDGETVMMSIDHGEYYGLDKIASHIWELLDSEMKVETLCQKLSRKYAVDTDQCLADTLPFLEDMAERKIIAVH